jgi:hypothetical protein
MLHQATLALSNSLTDEEIGMGLVYPRYFVFSVIRIEANI